MPFITAANAANLSKLAHDAKARLNIVRKEMQARNGNDMLSAYVNRRLSRVRRHVDMLSDMLEQETNAKALDQLASALSRLCEIERQLAGRPLPGSLRPVRETKAARATITLTPEPQAAVVQPKPVQGPDVKP